MLPVPSTFSAFLPSYCITSLPTYCLFTEAHSCPCLPRKIAAFVSLQNFSAFSPNAQAYQKLPCGTQASVAFKALQRSPMCSHSGKPLHQRTRNMCKANWSYTCRLSPKQRKSEDDISKCLEILVLHFNFNSVSPFSFYRV